jgi:hypothetical protein
MTIIGRWAKTTYFATAQNSEPVVTKNAAKIKVAIKIADPPAKAPKTDAFNLKWNLLCKPNIL